LAKHQPAVADPAAMGPAAANPASGSDPAVGVTGAAIAGAAGSRLVGVDVARSLAIFGMITVHTGVPFLSGGASGAIYELTRGRSAILFAFLAGVSLALISGRRTPARGIHGRAVAVKVATRAIILLAVGSYLATLDSGVAVILNYYGLFFLLALPLLWLRAPALMVVAVVVAATGPQLSFLIRWAFEYGPLPYEWLDNANAVDPLHRLAGDGVLDLLLTGSYPAFTFMAFLAAGLAVGRLDLRSEWVQLMLLAVGSTLAAIGYGVSAFVLHGLGLMSHLSVLPTAAPYGGSGGTEVEKTLGRMFGTVPADDPGWLFIASPHSGTSFEILGSTGVALAVLAGCLLIGDRAGRALFPLAAVGSMALTIYTLHVLILAWINAPDSALALLHDIQPEFFVVAAVLFATLWRLALGRGPLERLLGAVASITAKAVTGKQAVPRAQAVTR
jgi:uncharacterized membrane protein